MLVLPVSNQNYKPNFTAKLNPELYNKFKLMAKNKTDIKALDFQVNRIAGLGNKNTEISIYENSKQSLPKNRMHLLVHTSRYFGMFASFTNDLAPSHAAVEKQVTQKVLPINLSILNKINSEMVENAEAELCKSELENGHFKSAAEYFESKTPKQQKEKRIFWRPFSVFNRK